jgi:hypothetical protein
VRIVVLGRERNAVVCCVIASIYSGFRATLWSILTQVGQKPLICFVQLSDFNVIFREHADDFKVPLLQLENDDGEEHATSAIVS